MHALTKRELLDAIQSAVQKRPENCIIGNHNLHSVYLFHRDAEMRRFYNRNLYTHIDGMSVILLARLLGLDLESNRKTSYLDWFDEFLLLAETESWKIYFVGGTPEVSESLPHVLHKRYPSLSIRSHHGFDGFDPATTVFDEFENLPRILWLSGWGCPCRKNGSCMHPAS